MHVLPIVQSSDLILPAVVDVRHSTMINVCPGRTIVDYVVLPDIDLANVNRSIVDQIVPGSVSNIWTIPDIIPNPITNVRAICARQC
jgi:hypothetical protein